MIRKVLFVDDDQIMLLAIEKRFAAYEDSFSMIMANDGYEAVQKLKETSVSLIVLDLKMPRMDGMSLLSHTREKYPDIPVIIVSGYRTAEMYKLAKAKGVIAYISKPFQVDDLGKIIMTTMQKEADGGIMHNVSPTVFLQLMEMESKSCTIRIIDKISQKGGILYFKDGQLLDVRIAEQRGINAAYRVFAWDEVTLFIQNECADRENMINSDLQPIIMKAVGMKDESDESYIEEDTSFSDENISNELEDLSSLNDDIPDLGESYEFSDSSIKDISDELQRAAEEAAEPQPKEPAVEKQASAPPKTTQKIDATPLPETKEKKTQTKAKAAASREKNDVEVIRDLLLNEVGEKCGLEDIFQDDTMGNVIEYLTELGSLFKFGKLKVGYIDNGKETDRVVIPGQKTTVLKVNPKCPQDKILQVISDFC